MKQLYLGPKQSRNIFISSEYDDRNITDFENIVFFYIKKHNMKSPSI